MKKSEAAFTLARIVSDFLAIMGALVVAYYTRMVWFEPTILGQKIILFPPPETLYPFASFESFIAKFTIGMVGLLALNGRYRFGVDEKLWGEIKSITWIISVGMALLVVYFFFDQFPFFSRLIFGLSWGLIILFVLFGRLVLRFIRHKFRQKGFGQKSVLILGSGVMAKEVITAFSRSPLYNIIGVLTEKKEARITKHGHLVLGSMADFESVLKKYKPEEVCLAQASSSKKITAKLVQITQTHHGTFQFVPDELGMDMAAVEVSGIGPYPLITFQNTRIKGWGLVLKTIFDYIGAFFMTLLLSPIFMLLSIIIKVSDFKSPVFYRSMRIGKKGRIFPCFKFRTMVPDAEIQKKNLLAKNEREGAVLFKMKDDPRVTTIGKFLRKYSLDELPQIFNILRGEMSLIGPRPHLPEEVAKYKTEDLQILMIKPGMSGFSQVNGHSTLSFEAEMKYEIFYMKKWSIWLDGLIFMKSIWIFLRGGNQ